MKIEEIRNEFNEICESKIIKLDFDILTSSIRMSLELADDCDARNCQLVFENVSSHYFVNNTKEKRKEFVEFENGDYLEMTSIDIIDGSLTIEPKAHEKWIEQYEASANIAIEIWSRILLIEASKVIIGDKEFDLA